jgi:hypothetical protein
MMNNIWTHLFNDGFNKAIHTGYTILNKESEILVLNINYKSQRPFTYSSNTKNNFRQITLPQLN